MQTITSPQKTSILINRNFTLLWIGQTISQVGDFFFDTTLVLWIATSLARGQSWAPLAVSGIVFAAALPTLIIGPIAGVFVDRWDKRKIMLRMDILRATLLLLVLLVTGFIPLPFATSNSLPIFWKLGIIYSIVILVNVCSQFFNPSRLALIGDIVPEPLRTRASGLSQATFNLALIIGPSLAAPLFFVFGAQWAIMIDVVSFLISFLAILLIHTPKAALSDLLNQKHYFLQELAQGLHFFKGDRILIVLVIAGVIFQAGAGASDALYIFFVLSNLHTPLNLAGLFCPAYGAGVIAASFIAAFFASRLGEARVLSFSLIAWGFTMLVFARLTNFIPGLFAFFLLGVFNAGINVTVGPLLLHTTPREFVGRISSMLTPSVTLASMISAALSGYLVSTALHSFHGRLLGLTFSSLDTIFTGTGILVVSAGIYVMIALRGVMHQSSSSPSS